MTKRVRPFTWVRLAWASVMLVVVPQTPGRFGSHHWIPPVWESCLAVYWLYSVVQIRRTLRAPAPELAPSP